MVSLVPVELGASKLRCRLLDPVRGLTRREVILESGESCTVVPGEIAIVKVRNTKPSSGCRVVIGEIVDHRLDIAALRLVPLRLESLSRWEPTQPDWCREAEPLAEWTRLPRIVQVARSAFEMERVLPRLNVDDPFADPFLEAGDLRAGCDPLGASRVLMDVLAVDVRCLDAHAHLGRFVFSLDPALALRHYEVGVRIGELSLAAGFDGVLAWGFTDNQPFLRCLNGFGLCLWRLGRLDEARDVFERLLWLDPTDSQGARFLLPQVRAGIVWEERSYELRSDE